MVWTIGRPVRRPSLESQNVQGPSAAEHALAFGLNGVESMYGRYLLTEGSVLLKRDQGLPD